VGRPRNSGRSLLPRNDCRDQSAIDFARRHPVQISARLLLQRGRWRSVRNCALSSQTGTKQKGPDTDTRQAGPRGDEQAQGLSATPQTQQGDSRQARHKRRSRKSTRNRRHGAPRTARRQNDVLLLIDPQNKSRRTDRCPAITRRNLEFILDGHPSAVPLFAVNGST